MFRNTIISILWLAFATLIKANELPSSVTLCDRTHPDFLECVKKSIQDVKEILVRGIPEKGIDSIDPMPIDHFEIKDKEGTQNRLFTLNQKYKDVTVTGFGDFEIKDATWEFKDKCKFNAKAFMPRMNINGKYETTGQLMVFQIKGKGAANLTFIDVAVRASFNCDFKKNEQNENIVHIKTFSFDINPKKVYLDFENLFDGNPELSATLSQFINENSLLLFGELKEGYQRMFNARFKTLTNRLLEDIPVSKLFLD